MFQIINKINRSLSIATFLLASLVLTSCVETIAVGTIATGVAISQKKPVAKAFSQKARDVKITSAVTLKLMQNQMKSLNTNISANTKNGRVLLTGTSSSVKLAKKAQDLAWEVSGVKEVIDEINILPAKKMVIWQRNLKDSFFDSTITANIRLRLALTTNVSSAHHKIITNQRIAYIFGEVNSRNEAENILAVISTASGVKKVVSHLVVVK
jgi:osmotically-inducible protein OsmY